MSPEHKDWIFALLDIWSNRIEREVYMKSQDLMQLSEYDFITTPEAQLMSASKRLKESAAYIDKYLEQIARRRDIAA